MNLTEETLTNWKAQAKRRGTITKCQRKTKLSKVTIYKALTTGSMNVGTFALLSKFFNNLENTKLYRNQLNQNKDV